MTGGRVRWQGHDCGSAARATPARTGSRFRCPREQAEAFADALAHSPRSSRSAWRARFAAARGGSAALRPRPRSRDHAGHGRARLRVAKRRREEADFPAPRASCPSARRRRSRSASACSSRAASPCARARRCSTTTASEIGRVTSGGFAPTLGAPIAMAYVPAAIAAPGTDPPRQRGKVHDATVAAMPFVPHRYVPGAK